MAFISFKSALKPDSAVMIGLAEGAVIAAIYQSSLPNMADIRTAAPYNGDVEAARKRAAYKAAGVLGLVFLMTRDVNSFMIGGFMLAAIDLHVKHANAVHPATGKIAAAGGSITDAGMAAGGNAEAFPMPDYGGQGDMGGDDE